MCSNLFNATSVLNLGPTWHLLIEQIGVCPQDRNIPPQSHIWVVRNEASSMFGWANASRMSWQRLCSMTVSTVPGHLLLSITPPPSQRSKCQNPPALTSAHTGTFFIVHPFLHCVASNRKTETDQVKIRNHREKKKRDFFQSFPRGASLQSWLK